MEDTFCNLDSLKILRKTSEGMERQPLHRDSAAMKERWSHPTPLSGGKVVVANRQLENGQKSATSAQRPPRYVGTTQRATYRGFLLEQKSSAKAVWPLQERRFEVRLKSHRLPSLDANNRPDNYFCRTFAARALSSSSAFERCATERGAVLTYPIALRLSAHSCAPCRPCR